MCSKRARQCVGWIIRGHEGVTDTPQQHQAQPPAQHLLVHAHVLEYRRRRHCSDVGRETRALDEAPHALVMAASMSAACGYLDAAQAERVRRLIERAGLPTRIAAVAPAAALDHMRMDKKVLGGRLRLVLLRGIGEAFVTADYPPDALTRTLAAHFGGGG